MMKKLIGLLLLLGMMVAHSARAEEQVKVKVVELYLELHTGPALTFPVTYSVDQGRELVIVKERNDWYQLQNDEGFTGWAPRDVMEKTVVVSGVASSDIGKYFAAPWNQHFELGVAAGTLSGDFMVIYRGAYYYNEMWGAELSFSDISKDLSEADITNSMWMASLIAAPFGRRPLFGSTYYVPYAKLGLGMMNYRTADRAISDDSPKIDESAMVYSIGVGSRFDMARHLSLRVDADYLVASFDENDDMIDEVKEDLPSGEFALSVGFSFFF